MIVDIILYGSIAYLVAVLVWRLLLSKRAGGSGAPGNKASVLARQVFGRGWIYPGVAVALAVTAFVLRTDLGLISRWSEQERVELDHFVQALSYYDDASRLFANKSKLTNEDWESVNALLQAALAEGEQVSAELLQKLHPELPQKYQERLLAGLHTGTYGLRNYTSGPKKVDVDTFEYHNGDSLDAGRWLLGEWNKWFNVNRAQILDRVD